MAKKKPIPPAPKPVACRCGTGYYCRKHLAYNLPDTDTNRCILSIKKHRRGREVRRDDVD